ncbi:MAG TPA: hypothetical protein VMT76_11115 [Puia sp.]|nr:hypothetical protein [Puia sp.]
MHKKTIRLTLSFFFLLILSSPLSAQEHSGIGYTGASFNSYSSVAGGLSFILHENIFETNNSSFSLGTNIKIGIEDKIGSGIIIPAIVLLSAYSNSTPPNTGNANGGKINLFLGVPVLAHYNFGLNATGKSTARFGFYIGGGMSFINTGYTDTAGFSKSTSFVGYALDGGGGPLPKKC